MSPARLRPAIPALALTGLALALAACSGAPAGAAWTFTPVTANTSAAAPVVQAAAPVAQVPPAAAPEAQAAAYTPAAARTASLDLTIVTGDMIGKKDFPAYVPSDFSLPANATVTVTVTNFDDATALTGGAVVYAKAQGLVGGTFTVTPIDPKAPNASAGPTRTLSALDPTAVSHTFTIPTLGINVPIAAHSRVTFTIHTGAPGTYAWRCMDPCGGGPVGWGTAMAAQSGYMEGSLTVTD
jgi:hypothetical protein